MGAYPIKIEMLSRFRTAKEKRAVLDGLREGKVDIVIGTHGLVAESVQFKNLGLLIIDEEQRFGLKAKERLKKLRTEVDVLTLTATPIPRTLYMGLSGIRDISKIETPPAERLPIISYVGQWDDVVVQQAIRRELDRSGQIFFVHNRINSIDLVAQKLRRLIPDAVMAVAHGQMDERELARIMTRFADEQIDILLSTNIIESGLDIPNANTIIVDNADHFGLAELHQLRGRVGRSTVQAYAYFFHDRRSRMTEEARERLETLREVSGIGAGYAIAMRDLELRGSGDLLGPKQSGQISAVGFDLYTRLLSREVNTLRAMRDGTPLPEEEKKAVVLDLPLSVGLPESYIREDTLRIQLYRRVASLGSEEEIRAFEEELDDRFGKLPQPAKNLTFQVRLKLAATELGAQSITTDGNRFTIRAPAIEQMNRARLERLLGEDCVIGRTQVVYSRSGTPEQWKAKLMEIVRRLAAMQV
jgi:transcription-repair coupling factor (superfamily II helicase)